MKLLRAIAVAAAIFVLAPPPPASAQISPNAVWSCEFTNSPTDCGLYLEAVASNRATIVSPGRDGPTAVQLTTQPGDINIAGSGSNDRADLVLARSSTYCNQGQDEWWAHSLMFPPGYVPPPVASVWNWGALFDFHNSSPGGGQPNFMVYATPTGLELHMAGGPNTVNLPSDPGYYSIVIGPITKNVWYDFVYHVKWSSGADGLFQAWLNGQQVMNYSGANLYVGQSCYLKIANYHTELGVPVSVVHSRVVMGHTQADVQIGSPPPPTVLVPNVVGQMQAAATSAIISAGLTLGTVTMQSSTTVAPGNVISQSPAAGTSVASGLAVNLVVSSGAPPPAPVPVPNVVGQTQAAATSAITGAGLTVGTVTMQSSTTVPSGNVISESPAAGTKVASGSAVSLVVSSGPAQVAVPNVVGQMQAAATSAITGAGLTVGAVTQQSSSTVAAGNVISESPAAGTKVASGSAVSLVVSSGPAQVAVPNVVGQAQAAATSAITGAGLTVGTVTKQSSSTVAAGSVISESPTAGTKVASGSAVSLVVSSGPAQIAVPNVVGQMQAAAASAITGAGLTVGAVTQQSSSTVAAGSVISESPAAGTMVASGSAVSLVVSTGPTGPSQVAVPNVVGQMQAAAASAITGAGLTMGAVTQQSSSTVASGSVISESPTAGTMVASGSAVSLVVSSGPAQVAVPNVVGQMQAAATSAITGAGLTMGAVTQ